METKKEKIPTRGRPKGKSKGKKLVNRGMSPKINGPNNLVEQDTKIYCCSRCGEQTLDPTSKFYISRQSLAFVATGGYSTMCRTCANDLFKTLVVKHRDERLAFIMVCHYLDVYFDESLYDSKKNREDFSIGEYTKSLGLTQYRNKSFINFIIELIKEAKTLKTPEEAQEQRESEWQNSDKKNRNYVLETIGYDCFDDPNYNDENRKFLFNTLADYLTDDVIEDPHRVQRVIVLVKNLLQEDLIDRMINSEIKSTTSDESLIGDLIKTKKEISAIIEKIANENSFSSKTSGKASKTTSSFTAIVKEMLENDFDDAKINILDVKMSETYKYISEQNAKALFAELNTQPDEYARMLSEQAKFVEDLQDKLAIIEEENRKLKIRNQELMRGGK